MWFDAAWQAVADIRHPEMVGCTDNACDAHGENNESGLEQLGAAQLGDALVAAIERGPDGVGKEHGGLDCGRCAVGAIVGVEDMSIVGNANQACSLEEVSIDCD